MFFFSVIGSPCGPGEYVDSNDDCAPCATGAFMDEFNHQHPYCQPCEQGFYAASDGSTNCKSCPPGTITSYEGQDSCDPCLPGSYNPIAGSDTCVSCAPNTYADQPGMNII